MLTIAFSHQRFNHFLFNMIGLYSFGKHLVFHLGPMRFLALYGIGGIASSACQLMLYDKIPYTWPSYRDYSDRSRRSLGASGAINAITAYSILCSPTSPISIEFLPKPIPAAFAGLVIIFIDAYGLYYGGTDIGHGAHLGGALVGAVYFLVTRRIPPSSFRR
jgi:membrane associated rhomboid family serine protease